MRKNERKTHVINHLPPFNLHNFIISSITEVIHFQILHLIPVKAHVDHQDYVDHRTDNCFLKHKCKSIDVQEARTEYAP